jgi:serine phosphatase RsbU (regulator of sigma subunit)
MGVLIDIGITKTNKYASRESGDTVEVIERPGGGITIILADGQGSGRAAKTLSQIAVGRAAAMIKDGVRDRATAAGVSDHLLAYRHGQVSASLAMLSFDLRSREISAVRFGDGALWTRDGQGRLETQPDGPAAGLYPGAEPGCVEWPLEAGWMAVLCTDGILASGKRAGLEMLDLRSALERMGLASSAQDAADSLLAEALERDGHRASDDMTVVVARLLADDSEPVIRRMSVRAAYP